MVKKGVRKGISINLSKRMLYTLIAMGVFILVAIFVYAYSSGGPPNVIGHTPEEIDWNRVIPGTLTVSSGNDICISGGNCLSSISSGGGGLNVYQCPIRSDTCYGRTRVWPGGCNGQLSTTMTSCAYGNCGSNTDTCTYVGKLSS